MSTEIKKTFCSICSRNCGIDAHVENEKIVRVEPTKGHPASCGYICVKAYASRAYIYRDDRIKTPLRRTGKRGEGKFQRISWEEAYVEIAKKLNGFKAQFGPESVAFYTGYSKWYRSVFHRFVHSFGSLNYGTESSSCHKSAWMADLINSGTYNRPDITNTELFVAWAYNPYYNGNYANISVDSLQEKGLKVMTIDPRVTPFAQQSDIHLRPKPGTDGALALFFANYLISHGKIDHEYIENHVHGFEQYAAYAKNFHITDTARLTGIPENDLLKAAQLLASHAGCFAIHESNAPLSHHRNGFQNYRAIMALSAITGNFDRPGGNIPTAYSQEALNRNTLADEEFIHAVRPQNIKGKIGSTRFPLWSEIVDEFQAMDMSRHILEGTPYPIKAVFSLGMNISMFPGNDHLLEALKHIDFFVNTDIFLTRACHYADIVLPACTSFERSELQNFSAFVRYVEPAIRPLYESKSDVDILCELARALDLHDDILKGGYEQCCKYLLKNIGLTLADLRLSPLPLRIPGFIPYRPGSNTRSGYNTPTGKYELYSETIAAIDKRYGLDSLPTYKPSLDEGDEKRFPLTLTAGGRLPGRFHSRLNAVKWLKVLSPYAVVDINPKDARRLHIRHNDDVELETASGSLRLKANLTHIVPENAVFMYQDYPEADVNSIIPADHLDPYSGFPGYRTLRCAVRKVTK